MDRHTYRSSRPYKYHNTLDSDLIQLLLLYTALHSGEWYHLLSGYYQAQI